MTSPAEGTVPLRSEQDVVLCRQAVRQLTQALKLSLVDQTKMITAASELARNTVKYGGGGEMRWQVLDERVRRGLRLAFEDRGPGIADVAQAMTDGYTSGNGLGMGLGGARRLVNEFDIRTEPGVGTCVTITRWT